MPSFLATQHPIGSAADAEAYLARLSAFAVLLDQETARVRADFARGVVPPDFVLTTTLTLQLNPGAGVRRDRRVQEERGAPSQRKEKPPGLSARGFLLSSDRPETRTS